MQFPFYKMRYSVESRERRYIKGYGFLSFTKKLGKNISNKYSQKLVGNAKKSATDVIKTASKTAIEKTAEATGDLIGNKIAERLRVYQKNLENYHQRNCIQIKLIMEYQKKDIYLQKKGSKFLMNYDWYNNIIM